MKPTITYDDFDKLDLRIGKVVAAEVPEWSKKLLKLTVDFGPEIGTKTILSGIQKWYTPADFIDKKFPFIVNLVERKMGEGVSQGMMLMADSTVGDEERPFFIPVEADVEPGTIIR